MTTSAPSRLPAISNSAARTQEIIPQTQLYPAYAPVLAGTPFSNGAVQLHLSGLVDKHYVLQTSTNLVNWTALNTHAATAAPFYLTDPGAGGFRCRFYRVVQQP